MIDVTDMLIILDEKSYQICDNALAGNTSSIYVIKAYPLNMLRNGDTRDAFESKSKLCSKQDLNLLPIVY